MILFSPKIAYSQKLIAKKGFYSIILLLAVWQYQIPDLEIEIQIRKLIVPINVSRFHNSAIWVPLFVSPMLESTVLTLFVAGLKIFVEWWGGVFATTPF